MDALYTLCVWSKTKIEACTRDFSWSQCLIYGGKQLKDQTLLCACNMGKDSTINLMLQLHGGVLGFKVPSTSKPMAFKNVVKTTRLIPIQMLQRLRSNS